MADAIEPGNAERHRLTPGTKVEVRTGFDRSWASGFLVERVVEDNGYELRRSSDGSLLPAVFPFDGVRRERNRSMWWF